MILLNKEEENKVFIDDDVVEKFYTHEEITKMFPELADEENAFHGKSVFSVLFKEEEILTSASDIYYDKEEDHIILVSDGSEILEKAIKDDELISISLYNDDTIVITTFKLPVYMTKSIDDGIYPKFDINISDCVYNMKIYLDESEYIDIPFYQSHSDILSTLDHINDVIYCLTEDKPKFIYDLCNKEKIELSIYDKDKKCLGCNVCEYKIGQDGIVLFNECFDDGLFHVEWQILFRLVIDKTWEIDFDLD